MVGRLELQDVFKEQAEWRREKAKQYPIEEHNLEAAAIFDRLAATVDAIPQDVFVALSELRNVDDCLLDVERWTEMLCDVARHREPPRTSSDPLLRIERCGTCNGGICH
jgi:hypothetical protein